MITRYRELTRHHVRLVILKEVINCSKLMVDYYILSLCFDLTMRLLVVDWDSGNIIEALDTKWVTIEGLVQSKVMEGASERVQVRFRMKHHGFCMKLTDFVLKIMYFVLKTAVFCSIKVSIGGPGFNPSREYSARLIRLV